MSDDAISGGPAAAKAMAGRQRTDDGGQNSDAELLRSYAEDESEAAFAELVQRHLDLVYSAALRRLGGDTHATADVAQQVFVALARQAASLTRCAVLPGWLYATTRNVAVDFIRAEQRRRAREQEAHIMHELTSPPPSDAGWEQMRPLLDAAVDELSDADREAVLLRFFARRPFAQIGAALHLREDAARMRVERALDKLRVLLARRGVTSTTTALATLLANQTVTAAPAGLALAITGAMAGGAAASGGLASALSFFAFMNTSNLSTSAAVLAALAALGVAVRETRADRTSGTALAAATQENQNAAGRLRELTQRAAAIEQQTAELQSALAQARAAVVQATPIPVVAVPTPAEAGREFLAAHPEAQALIVAIGHGFFAETEGAILQSLGLTPAERDAIATEAAKEMTWNLGVGGLGFEVNPGGRRNGELERLRQLLGDSRFEQYAELRRLQGARSLAQTVAAATYDSDTPLTREQADAIVQSMKRHSPAVSDKPVALNLNTIDWPAVATELSSVLSQSQLAVFDAVRVSATSGRTPPTPPPTPAGAPKP